jgi:hypothetical protein
LDELNHVADGDTGWGAGQGVAPVAAAPGVYEPGLLQLAEDHLQESRWDRLRVGNLGDLDRPLAPSPGQLEYRSQGILALLRYEHETQPS